MNKHSITLGYASSSSTGDVSETSTAMMETIKWNRCFYLFFYFNNVRNVCLSLSSNMFLHCYVVAFSLQMKIDESTSFENMSTSGISMCDTVNLLWLSLLLFTFISKNKTRSLSDENRLNNTKKRKWNTREDLTKIREILSSLRFNLIMSYFRIFDFFLNYHFVIV